MVPDTYCAPYIRKGHFFDSRLGQQSSRFRQANSTPGRVKSLVQEAVAKGEHASNSRGQTSVRHTFDDVIGTDSLLKRVTGIGRLRVRGKASVFMAMLLTVVGWNILQASRSKALMRALMGLFSSLMRYCMRCALHRRSSQTLRRRSVLTAPV